MSVLFKFLQILGSVGLAFVPPTGDLDLETEKGQATFKWRVIMASSVYALVVAVLVHVIWACGIFPGTGFAHAADTNRILANQIAAQIYERKKDYCAAPEGADGDRARQQHWEALEIMRAEYRSLAGEPYNEPACIDL